MECIMYTKSKIRFNPKEVKANKNEFSRWEFNRSLKASIELSATSHSNQTVFGTRIYEWDNIAPEIALVILQDAREKGKNIQKELIQIKGETRYNHEVIQQVLDTIHKNPDYLLFSQKFALFLNPDAKELSLDLLLQSGIDTPEKLDEKYIAFLTRQEKLTKNFPDFQKINEEVDDFDQVLGYFASKPLYEKFLKAYTTRLAREFNRGRPPGDQVKPLENISKNALIAFFKKMGVNNVKLLKASGMNYLNSSETAYLHDIFLAQIPSTDLVKDTKNKYILYKWLEIGNNLSIFKDFIANDALQRYINKLHEYKKAFNDPKVSEKMDKIVAQMDEIVKVISTLDENQSRDDQILDDWVSDLVGNLKDIKEYYEGIGQLETFHSFVRKIVFNSPSDKVVNIVTNTNPLNNQQKTMKINLNDLIMQAIEGKPQVNIRSVRPNKADTESWYDNKGNLHRPQTAIREQLKIHVSRQLKGNVHHYYTQKSYLNDNLSVDQAPLGFRGGTLQSDLEKTAAHAKKYTREGEFSADSHLFVGQENNLGKHEIRAGSTAALIAATGVDGTRSVTDNLKVAVDFGKDTEIKILYVLRGKQVFHTQRYLEPTGKNKLSEMAYTHLQPEDFVMTIILNKHNEILEVIPGNLAEEIHGVSLEAQKILEAGVEFYNQKHAGVENPKVSLPPVDSKNALPTRPLHHTSSLNELVKSHLTAAAVPATTSSTYIENLGKFRIDRENSATALRTLKLQALSNSSRLTPPVSPAQSFNPGVKWKKAPSMSQIEQKRRDMVVYYNQRHVWDLNPLSTWSDQEIENHKKTNRIFQHGFLQENIDELIHHAKIANLNWLTDVACPTINTALSQHIAAALFTDYKIDNEAVNEASHTLYQRLITKNPLVSSDLNKQVEEKLKDSKEEIGQKTQELIDALAVNEPVTDENSRSCHYLAEQMIRKKIIHEVVSDYIDENLPALVDRLKLGKKPSLPHHQNRDFVLLGPPASGKSTVSKQYFSSEEKNGYVTLATDDYRGITLPGARSVAFEARKTDQVFTRTQDSSYLLKEIIINRMNKKKDNRPNVIIDVVTYEKSLKEIVDGNEKTTIIFACLDDVDKAVSRSYQRAQAEEAGSADKGRYVNTTNLLAQHKYAGINLLMFFSPGESIDLFDTNLASKEDKPFLMGNLSNEGDEKILKIQVAGLAKLTDFFNKERTNTAAINQSTTFFRQVSKNPFKVEAVLNLLNPPANLEKLSLYETFDNGEQRPFLTIKKIEGKMIVEIHDLQALSQALDKPTVEATLLKHLIIQAHLGGIKEARKALFVHDKKNIDKVVNNCLTEIIAKTSTQEPSKNIIDSGMRL